MLTAREQTTGNTPFHTLIIRGKETNFFVDNNILKLMLHQKTDLSVKNKEGLTCIAAEDIRKYLNSLPENETQSLLILLKSQKTNQNNDVSPHDGKQEENPSQFSRSPAST